MQAACNSGPSNMYILAFFDHDHCLMSQSSCLVGFHTKAQRISLFYPLYFLTERSPWYSRSVCCRWLISCSLFSACFYFKFFFLSSPTVCFSVCLIFSYPFWISLCHPLPSVFHPFLCLSLSFCDSLPSSVSLCSSLGMSSHCRGEIRRSRLMEASLHSHSQAPPKRALQ